MLTHTLWLLAKLAALQRVLSLPKLVHRFDAKQRAEIAASIELDRLIWLTRGLLRRIYGNHFCVQQTLILFYFLRRYNYPARINIGVVKHEGKLVGHAWLDLNGQPVAETRDPNLVYKTTFSYP